MIDELVALVGPENVLTGSNADAYGKDWLGKYVARPLAVVRPESTDQVSKIVKLANQNGTPIVPVGGNTGLTGATYAKDSVMVSMERMNAIREVRPEARVAIVESGAILSQIHDASDAHDLAFPLFFGARGSAMIGGALSTNAGGSNVLRYGNTRALCLGLEVVLPNGDVMNLMSELHKDNSGYDLKDLFIGAEGTLGIITAAVLKLVPKPQAYATAMVAAKSLPASLTMLNRLQEATGGMVEAFEFMPRTYLDRMKVVLPELTPPLGYDHDCTILVELGATAPRDTQVAEDGTIPLTDLLEDTLADMISEDLANDAVIAKSATQRLEMWRMREAAAEITLNRKPIVDTDVAVPLDKVATFLDLAHDELKVIDPDADTITVCHLGDGNLHFSVWPTSDDEDLMDGIREMIEAITIDLGGSFSAEHGIGLSKLNSMRRRKDQVAIETMRSIKRALDPNNIMNPGKVVP